MKRAAGFAFAIAALALVVAGLAAARRQAPAPTASKGTALVPSVTINGDVPALLTLKTSELAVLPQQTVKVSVGGTTYTESGPLLSALLTYAGVQYDSACKNDELRYWVEVTGADGQAVTLTAGELDPGFGNRPAILSIDQNGSFLTKAGPRLIVPNDATGARDLSHVSVITFGRAPAQLADVTPACASTSLVSTPPAGSVVVNGDVKTPITLTWTQLQAMAQTTQNVSFLSGANPTVDSESGPTLYSILEAAQPRFLACDPTDRLRFYVEITSSEDGYASLLSWSEIDPSLDDDNALMSLAENGALQAGVGPRLTVPGDVKGGRYVSGGAVITVFRAPTEVRIPACAGR